MIKLPKSLFCECDIAYEKARDIHHYEKTVALEVVKCQLIAAANQLYREWLDSFEESKSAPLVTPVDLFSTGQIG